MTVPVRKNEIQRFADSIRYIHSLNLKQKERLCDEIYEKQPELLFEALMLRHAGVPAEKMDHVLHLLMVFYDYFNQRGKRPLRRITQTMVHACRKNTIAMIRFIQKEGPENAWPLMQKAAEHHPAAEPLAYLAGYLKDNGFTQHNPHNEPCIFTAKVILECFVMAEKKLEQAKERRKRNGKQIPLRKGLDGRGRGI